MVFSTDPTEKLLAAKTLLFEVKKFVQSCDSELEEEMLVNLLFTIF
jgi:hypothetical protein